MINVNESNSGSHVENNSVDEERYDEEADDLEEAWK